ncbi:uncharacterized protein LOC128026975 [Carassius gibelio]|uniref:uncharacterized protein LOC128026975 n=1 Tax=Carassius gibelio TaxID=101364 RepID=UPI002279C5CA|nr:uncharacterized protein LOC128026975 [Carassius gibelio]
MEHWVLEGDRYSFLRSAPHAFNLQNREGPNRVEIFDITSIPSHRNAISETTCLCDIFGDDCESSLLSSIPASAAFIRREVDQSFPADDSNDSSGFYHTANGSDLSDNTEVNYNILSPKNIQNFPTSETRESRSTPAKSTILSHTNNGFKPLDCTPSASKVNGNDLSHTDNWEEPQVSVNSAPVNETGITNESEPQYVNSTTAATLINPANGPSKTSSCSSEEKEPAIFEQEGIIKTPQHSSTNPFLDKQLFESVSESLAGYPHEQNNVMSSENKESMDHQCPKEQNIIFSQGLLNSGPALELSNPSPTDCSPMQEMSTSPSNRDINFLLIASDMTDPRLTSTTPVSSETTSTPASTGRSSPELLNLCSTQVKHASEFPNLEDTYGASLSVSTLPTRDNVEIDYLTVSTISTEIREMVCSSIDGRERLERPEIYETCSSLEHSAPAHSPQPILIHSPVGYTISPSPTCHKIVSSIEPEDSLTSPVSPEINETCTSSEPSASAHSPEPVRIHSTVGDIISPSPTCEKIVYSVELEDSPSSPVSPEINEICSSSEHSAPFHSPEPVLIPFTVGYTISPSPTFEKIVYSVEPEDSPSSPVSPEINEICSSSEHSAPSHSPEQVLIHSPVGYTISPSHTCEKIVYSVELEDSPSSPVSPEINETFSSSEHSAHAHSTEPVLIHSPVGYIISPSPTCEKIVYSVKPEDSPSSPVSPEINEICSSSEHSAPFHSPEPVLIPFTVGYTISPSPTFEKIVYSVEPEDSPSSPVSPEINEICSSSEHSAPSHSPEQVLIHSPVGYTISPSHTCEKIVYSVELEDSPSSPVSPEINETFPSSEHSAPDRSPEPVLIHSPVGYAISPSPTCEKIVYSVEPEDSPSSPVSPEINEICSSSEHSAPFHSPEPVLIHSPVGYTISPSPTFEKIVYSVEPEDSPSSPVSPEINEICSSSEHSAPFHSPEPVLIHSPVGYTISPSPTFEKIVYSVEPEDSPSSPVSPEINEICSSSEHSAPFHSPEPVLIPFTVGYTISPSPTFEKIVYSVEPEDSPSSPVSPEINEICSSSEHSAPSHSPEQVLIHSPVGYTISPSHTCEKIVYSVELEDSPSSPVSPEINETFPSSEHSAPDRSPEPVLIHSTVGYAISPSPTCEKIVYSVEPEDSPSSPVSPAINEICSSSEHSAPFHSPEPVLIPFTVGYTISPSPTFEKIVYSVEPEDSPSSPVSPEINEICSSSEHSAPAHSAEPVPIHSPVGYTISPSPTFEKITSSTDPEDSPSFPVVTRIDYSDICSSPDHSVPAHSPEPEIIHSLMGFTISPSPTHKIMFFSVEPDDLPFSPAITGTDYTVTPTRGRDSTPVLRSITSTPNSRENYRSPEPNSPAPSLELRSVNCSPEIKTISYSVLPQNTKSSGITYSVIQSEDLAQCPAVEKNVCGNSSETSNYIFGNDTSVLPISRNFLSTPESRSRPLSAASDHTKHTAQPYYLQPEPSVTLEKKENQTLSIICDGINHPFSNPIDRYNCFDDLADTKIPKSLASVPDECKGNGPPVLSQMQILQASTSKTSDSGLSTEKIEKNQEIVTHNTTDLTVCGTPTSRSPWAASAALPKPMISVQMKQCHVEGFDSSEGTEMLKNYSPNSNKRLSQVPVALRHSPGVIRRDNGGEFDRQSCREKEESGKEGGEGEETIGETSYRGEQVELSFRARNRKGPAGHSPARSCQDPKSGIPARCYFESHPTTLQQQGQLRAQDSQQKNKVGTRRLQSAAQGKYSSAGFLPPECTGETSSMGSEFDEADNEVKWFTDLAFRSLSSPQVDYLDVYNSSHRSSTNLSQPSTVDSPGAVAWMTYADLHGSTLHENDGSSFLPRDSMDLNKHLEIGSFECVDVALENKDESSRGKRTVPKRQIQLLRRNTVESKYRGNTEHILNSPSTHRRSKDTLVRQHSTPAFLPKEFSKEVPDSPQNDRKKTLQKSVSLDDGSPNTQMASCIIKSVLSKKMQDVQKETAKSTDPGRSADKNKHPDVSLSPFFGVPSTMEEHSLSPSLHSQCTLSSEDLAVGEERISHRQLKKCAPKVPPKPLLRPAFFNTGEARVAGNITREEAKPILAHPQVDDKMQNCKSDGKEGGGSNIEEKYNRDSENASIRNKSPATPAISLPSKMTSRDIKKCQMTPENQEQLAEKSVFTSKTPEITLKTSSIKQKKTSSLKVSPSPDLEQSREISETQTMEKAAEDISTRSTKVTETEDNDDSNKKSVIHRVRDVRKLVKNTYNLSFKASNSTSNAEDMVIQEKREKPPQTPPALQIECKAIRWKDKQTPGNKALHCHDEKQPVDRSKILQQRVCAETRRDANVTEIKSKVSSPKTKSQQKLPTTTTDGLPESESITKRSYIHCDQSSKMPPRPLSKEREVSALMVLPDCKPKTKNVAPTVLDSTQMKAPSSSHSVSMLLKEKGMQADIGVCDVITEGANATAKHVNRLEVPVQACLSEIILSEGQVKNTSLPCNPTALVNDSSRTSQPSESPKGTLTETFLKEQERKQITATYLATSEKPEMRSFSCSTKNNATPMNPSKEIELPIQVRSISTDRLKTFVPPKPSYKQSFAEITSVSSDQSKADTQAPSVITQQTKLNSESKKNETPLTVKHKDQPNETSSRDTKGLAVSAVSSYKQPSIPVTSTPSVVQKSTTKTLFSLDQQQSSAFLQTTSTCQQQSPSFSQDQSILDSSFASNPSGPQTLGHTESMTRASSNNRFHTDEYLFYASDDPPSYDEKESFSPLQLSDLPPHRLCRYHPTTKQSSCSCTQSSHLHQGHPHHSPQERVPAASLSPGQVLTCPRAPPQAQVRPRQCRPDGLPVSDTTIQHASALVQPLHNPRACPVSNSQSYGDDQPPTSGLHVDRRPANHPSPQAAGPAPYHEYSNLANMSIVDPRAQLFNPQDYANECPGGAGELYPETTTGLSCGQGSRRVLLDPETGKYFYIEVPMQPLRKMLFDPELGQYVEVLIPQQAMSHSGLYPPAAPPYSSLHSPGLYAPQYLPYAVPSYPAISGSAQQVRHPEPPPVPTTLHQTSLRYGSPASQMPKNELKGHSSLDQSYLDSMYYIPTGINASPNSTTSDCYHEPSSMPHSGGRRA